MNFEDLSTRNGERGIFDVIVVGAGIGGLICAAKLSLSGKRVLVFEKNGFIGGRCASYQKEGFTIDYGVHAFALGENGPLQEVVIEAERQKIIPKSFLTWEKVPVKLKYGKTILPLHLPMDWKHFWNFFRNAFGFLRMKCPSLQDKYAIAKTSMALYYINPKRPEELETVSVKELVMRYTKSQMAHQLIASSADCVSVIPYNDFAARDYVDILHGIARNGGIRYPCGGCGAIPDTYRQIIERRGGKIITGCPVKEILVEEHAPSGSNRVVGVKIAKGSREILAPRVVVNIHQKMFFREMIPRDTLPEGTAKRLQSFKTSRSAVVVHIALDKPIIKDKLIMESPVLHLLPGSNSDYDSDLTGGMFPVVSNIDPNLAPPGKQLVIAGMGLDSACTHEKDMLVERLLEGLQKMCQKKYKLRDHIEWYDVFGPREFESLFGEEGAIVGIAGTPEQGRAARINSMLWISGLYHCGDDSGTNLWGVGTELAAKSGLECARLLMEGD